jgi:hypothetical protein
VNAVARGALAFALTFALLGAVDHFAIRLSPWIAIAIGMVVGLACTASAWWLAWRAPTGGDGRDHR